MVHYLLPFFPLCCSSTGRVFLKNAYFTTSKRFCSSAASRKPRDVKSLFNLLASMAPVFAVHGEKITVINEPKDFYQHLKTGIEKASQRVVLASLYLGTGKLEQDLVKSLHDSVSKAQEANGHLSVDILLDYTRGSRGSVSSRTMLLPLIKQFPESLRVSLFHSPDLRGILKRILPERYNEVIGLNHMKVYIWDDNLMLSGANLSSDYFTNRQDRYVLIENCADITDFFHGLVKTVQSFSFDLLPDDKTKIADGCTAHPYKDSDNGRKYRSFAGEKITNYIEMYKQRTEHTMITEHSSPKSDNVIDTDLTRKSSESPDTWIFPLVQMYSVGVRQDEIVTSELLSTAHPDSTISLASAYFNLTRKYTDIIVSSEARYNILMAHPLVNGFYGAKGISGGIPDAYTQYEKEFFHKVSQNGQDHRIKLQEYIRDKWTFHVKGLWYYLPQQSLPSMTLVGSPNFGYRSVYRDLEAQVAIVTTNSKLQKQFEDEQAQIFQYENQVTEQTFKQEDRRVPAWVYIFALFIKTRM